MVAMIRFKGKPTKIAWKVLGKPQNLQDNKTAQDKYIDRRLFMEETYRVR